MHKNLVDFYEASFFLFKLKSDVEIVKSHILIKCCMYFTLYIYISCIYVQVKQPLSLIENNHLSICTFEERNKLFYV